MDERPGEDPQNQPEQTPPGSTPSTGPSSPAGSGVPSDASASAGPDPVSGAPSPTGSAAPADTQSRPFFYRPGPLLGGALVIGLLAGLLGGYLGQVAASSSNSSGSSPTSSTSSAGSAGSEAVCNAVTVSEKVLPAIVTINVVSDAGGGVGTGSIIRDDGYIITNNHVIADAANGASIYVTFSNGQQVPASLVGRDARRDIAVVKVDVGDKLPAVELGNSDTLAVGQPVVALGAPLGLSSTVTAGIVSALGRDVPVPSDDPLGALLVGAVQTDAAINPGNSGGALVDCSGAQIGVNTAIATVPSASGAAGGGSVGIGFAVPINVAKSIADQLIKNGTVSNPYFGMQVVVIPQAVAEQFDTPRGLFVEGVTEGGPAADAGIEAGDIITELDGQPATTISVLTRLQLTKQVGDTVEVTYLRDKQEKKTTVTLGATP